MHIHIMTHEMRYKLCQRYRAHIEMRAYCYIRHAICYFSMPPCAAAYAIIYDICCCRAKCHATLHTAMPLFTPAAALSHCHYLITVSHYMFVTVAYRHGLEGCLLACHGACFASLSCLSYTHTHTHNAAATLAHIITHHIHGKKLGRRHN